MHEYTSNLSIMLINVIMFKTRIVNRSKDSKYVYGKGREGEEEVDEGERNTGKF